VFEVGVYLGGAELYFYELREENDLLPKFDEIPEDIARRAKYIMVSYPYNPVCAVAPTSFYEELIAYAKKYNIIVVHDNAYSEISYDGYKAPSFLEASGAMDVGIETHSLSKTYNMTGWRIGMAVGNADLIGAFGRVKTNIDSGAFDAIQRAAITALTGPQDCVAHACAIYQERRDALVAGLQSLGFTVHVPKATFYVWMKVNNSVEFTQRMVNEAGIVVTPGTGFGPNGEGYVRFAITRPVERINEAIARMKEHNITGN
ncbi:MAG TPA: aminotransferase class I/II-fold pyridoxal phosphate-dependent enzyme, partial [Methanocorpusculum sp.]|nr:aminotransferase class I/II-fold pyridoxal phosphate-dependent enzyme [Methanocorpusculum sp.]